jgi:uncharacterized membrane protein
MTTTTHKVSIRWQELDILRGLAAVLMVVNHSGYATLAPNLLSGSLPGNLVFIGSFAPVLFFFVTGVGYGIQSSKKKTNHWYAVLYKVVVLLLADQLLHWSGGIWLGIDFFGFIGLSSLVLELFRNSKSPLAYCLGGFALVSVMRYLIGPELRFGYDQKTSEWLGLLFGTHDTPGISYQLSPWLAYPLIGYLVGFAAVHYRDFVQKHRWQVICGALILGVIPATAGSILARNGGSSFFRWGTVAFGFYIVSFTIILVGMALSLAICGSRLRVCQNALSLRGIDTFAVVPLHYFLLDLLVMYGVSGLKTFSFYLLVISVLTISFLLARSVESFSQIIRQVQPQRFVWFYLVAMLLVAGLILISAPKNLLIVTFIKLFGQIVLCLLFVIRPPFLEPKVKQGGSAS